MCGKTAESVDHCYYRKGRGKHKITGIFIKSEILKTKRKAHIIIEMYCEDFNVFFVLRLKSL